MDGHHELREKYPSMPSTPLPDRLNFKQLTTGVSLIFFDFDGTLTATPGERAARREKQVELLQRSPLLAPRLRALRSAGASLGIISKSTEDTIRFALENAGLMCYFNAPIIGKAVGFEGKAGFVQDLAQSGELQRFGCSSLSRGPPPHGAGHARMLRRILLVDDDVSECERARAAGLQAYAVAAEGGLVDSDFDALQDFVVPESPRLARLPPLSAGVPKRPLRSAPSLLQAHMQMREAAKTKQLGTSGAAAGGAWWRSFILPSDECLEDAMREGAGELWHNLESPHSS